MPNSDRAGRPGVGVNRSSFLVGDLLLGKLGETVVVHGNAPFNGPRSFVVGNRAGFLGARLLTIQLPPLPQKSSSLT